MEQKRFGNISLLLHWVVGLCVLGLATLGLYMVNTESWGLYHLHKSLGILVAIPILLRVVWRMKEGFPVKDKRFSSFENRIAKSVQVGLLTISILLPISGMVYSAASGHGFGVFSWAIFPQNHSDEEPSQIVPMNEWLSEYGSLAHTILGYFILALVLLHILGALKHHFIYKNEILKRMFGFNQ